MKFYKYHGLGNDYIVMDPADQPLDLSASDIQAICHRNFGIGSDGILMGPIPTDKADFALRIFNPDGSEAEKAAMGCAFSPDICMTEKWCPTPRFPSLPWAALSDPAFTKTD
ncbi:MAG: hypothetical protein R2875_16455 [Desulfobacterales bacterium]